MSPDLDQEVNNSIQSSLKSFFVSPRGGPNMLNGFLRTWTTFNHTVQTHRDKLKEETLESIHNFAATIGTVAAAMSELEAEKEKMRTDVSDILNDHMDNLFIEEEQRCSEGDKPHAAYVKPCYDWLLSNIHNPYPLKEIRNHISRDTDSPCKDVDAWFTDARKRIGWNNLRKRHFSNKRVEIVNAATRFFELATDGYRPHTIRKPDLKDDHGSDFVAIRQRAKNLYSEGFFEPTLATTLDDVDLVPRKVASAQPDKSRGPRVHSSDKKYFDHAFSYPSPEYSPEPPAPSPLPDISHKAGRKRQVSDSDSETENYSERLHKRNRLDSPDTCDNLAIAGLPSPAPSLPDFSDNQFAVPDLPDAKPSSSSTVLQGKRKRRLSDAGNDGPPKRPHNALAVPRLQTVSDPLPLASPVFSELYKTISGRTISDSIPGPVSVESLDDTEVEVNFYTYNTSPDTIQPFLLANSSSGPCLPAPSLPSTATSGLSSLDGSQVFDPSFDFLFENYLKDLNPQASTDMPFFPDMPSHDLSALFPLENMFSTQPPQEDVFSDPLSYFQIPSPSWDFQGSGDSFSATAPSAGTLLSSNHVSPQINSTQNEKEAKLKQIEALRAQLQSLEAEL